VGGGKESSTNSIRKTYPLNLGKEIKKYAEPFVGGGAVLFDILSNYELEEYISVILMQSL
jgi:DNA adenine methylase